MPQIAAQSRIDDLEDETKADGPPCEPLPSIRSSNVRGQSNDALSRTARVSYMLSEERPIIRCLREGGENVHSSAVDSVRRCSPRSGPSAFRRMVRSPYARCITRFRGAPRVARLEPNRSLEAHCLLWIL